MKTWMQNRMLLIVIVFLIVLFPFTNAQIVDSPIIEATLAYQNPDPVQPGDEVELKWSVKNTGASTAKSAEFRIVPEYPFSVSAGETEMQAAGDISVYDAEKIETGETTVKYKLMVDDNAVEGEYQLLLEYRTEEGISRGNWIELEPFTVSVGGKATNVIVEKTKTEPELLGPGEEGTVTLTIANKGQSDIEDVKVTMNVDAVPEIAPVGMGNEVIVQKIAAGESLEVFFTILIDPSAEVKIYKVPIELAYQDERGNSYEKTTDVAIVVDAEPEYVLNVEESEVYAINQKGNIVVSLSNIGVSEIKYATLTLEPSEEYTVLSTDTTYLGNLESDDYETAQFTIYTNEYVEELPLHFVLVYKDAYNKNYEDEMTVTTKLFTGLQARKYGLKEGNGGILFIFLIFAGAAGFWYWWRYKRKKEKEKR